MPAPNVEHRPLFGKQGQDHGTRFFNSPEDSGRNEQWHVRNDPGTFHLGYLLAGNHHDKVDDWQDDGYKGDQVNDVGNVELSHRRH